MSSSYLHSSYNMDSSVPAVPANPPRKPQVENKPSKLLTRDENACVYELLGRGKLTLSTAVVQLLVPTHDQRHWQKKETGVVCFVRDQTKKSYFIQVYSLRERKMAFRQEIYNQFEYQMPQPFFLTFEGDSSMVGLNFADTEEAHAFRLVLDNKLEMKRKRRDERIRSRNMENIQHMNNSMGNMTVSSNHHRSSNNFNQTAPVLNGSSYPIATSIELKSKKNKKNDKKTKLSKADISNPTNFRHVQHVGWNADKGYDVDVKDPVFNKFFEKAGVNIDGADEDTKNFIYRFIEEAGGFDAVKNDVQNDLSFTGRPAAPAPTEWPRDDNHHQPPQLPPRGHSSGTGKSAPPAPPARPAPPKIISSSGPPVPTRNPGVSAPRVPAAPPAPSIPTSSSSGQSNGFVPPPPPPPPPPMGFGMPPLILPSGGSSYGDESDCSSTEINTATKQASGSSAGDRSELWQQIQSGVALKPVNKESTPKRTVDPKSELLEQIKSGTTILKPVIKDETPKSATVDDGLAGALKRALLYRREVISSDEDSGDEKEDNDDEEWD